MSQPASPDPTDSPALEALRQRILDAAGQRSPLRIRGAGSKDFYGEALKGELLETAGLSGIVAYEPSELVVTVRAGTPLAALEQALAERGQCLAFEPPHFGGTPTVGGMVAAGLGGPARPAAGSVRDYVLGAQMLNGRGELLSFGGQVMKNVAGYDVSRLLAGSLGILGLITEVSLKVLPLAPAEATLRFEMDAARALQQVNTWAGQPLPLNASVWQAGPGTGAGSLHLRLRGALAAVESACTQLGGERLDAPAASAFWTALRDQHSAWFAARGARELWRLSVPQTAPVLDLAQDTLLEWHGAQRWVLAEPGQGAGIRRVAEAAGGHATLWHNGAGAPAVPRMPPLAPAIERIHQALKREFDPAGIFNPGRLSAGF